ncbi:ImmA/IrrE family metallo-endopeptidase [Sabulicella rubraurantiaca]|uniref:ImmA/IrrE family metallo-endopeptidase n=1 Tax=Sabulicella rubraurantiaca TaxID=2811429 RepID=UPI001A964909|nr:ImmA/IrrE family metallo-endopeptidase [Sabulicella rubraurantiaca]
MDQMSRTQDLTFAPDRPVLVKPLRASREAVEAAADALGARLGFAPGEKLEEAVARLGGRIHRGGPNLWFRNQRLSFLADAPDRFELHLLGIATPARARLDLAHELGHFVLHDLALRREHGEGIRTAAPSMVSPHDAEGQRADLEAFWFAHQILMPAAAFREAWADGARDISAEDRLHRMATRFGVPMRSAEVRAEFLGLETSQQAA